MNRSRLLSLFAALAAALPAVRAQDPTPPKGPDPEVAAKIKTLKEAVADKKFARDAEAVKLIDELLMKLQAGADPKDQKEVVKAFDFVLNKSPKLRPADNAALYNGVVAALGGCGADGAKALKDAFEGKRFPDKTEWVPLREQMLKNVGKTKDDSMVKFLLDEARRSPEAALQKAAGEALGNFGEAKEAVRKDIVNQLLVTYGELSQKAGELGSSNVEAQNARDRLAAITKDWNDTLGKLTGQAFDKFLDWLSWYNKHKGESW